MEFPLISVIVPIYNVEQYLHKCVDSIIRQTYTKLEIILVDDGSLDNCSKICDQYALKDNRIKVIHKKNGGLSDARNVAINLAKGDYITFIDSDDYISSNYIMYLYQMAIKYNCQLSIVQPCVFTENSNPIYQPIKEHIKILTPIEAIESMFYQRDFETSAWGKLYHKSLFNNEIRYPKGLLFEDNPVTFRLLYQSNQIVISNQRLYFYLIRANSIEGSIYDKTKINSAVEIIKLMYQYPYITKLVKPAFKCKITSLAFHFVLKMPENSFETKELFRLIKSYRNAVIFNCNARLKTRLACILSYLGLNLTKTFFKFLDKRR